MKKTIVIVAIFFIAIFTVGVFKDQIIRSAVTVIATQVTGSPVHINGFSLGIFSRSIRISGFKMYNPKGFSKTILVDLPKINVKYDLDALIKKKLHLINIEVEIREIGLEKNKEGKLNVDELKVVKQARQQKTGPTEQMPMQIDMLTLGIGRIVSKDYSLARGPVVKVYEINRSKSYRNITSVQQLALLILAEPMKEAGIQGAKIYGVTLLAGVAVLPVAVAATFIGRDSAQQDFSSSFDNAYTKSLEVLKQEGRITGENKSRGVINAAVNSAQVTVKVEKQTDGKVRIIVSARKYLLPKPEIAGGVLYGISGKLKKS